MNETSQSREQISLQIELGPSLANRFVCNGVANGGRNSTAAQIALRPIATIGVWRWQGRDRSKAAVLAFVVPGQLVVQPLKKLFVRDRRSSHEENLFH